MDTHNFTKEELDAYQDVFNAFLSNTRLSCNYAISKEKQIKKWSRVKKKALIYSDYDSLISFSKKKFS